MTEREKKKDGRTGKQKEQGGREGKENCSEDLL